jgi:signal transduction histidine kinase/ligand-binding sensor domain-containing protein/CheY-like chemotaxis protein
MRSQKVRRRTTVALVWLILLPAGLDAQRYSFKRYDQDSGLLDQNIRALFQDRTGFLWVGTDNGLFRYDGHQFRGFAKADGLPSSQVEAIEQTTDGTLWVATLGGLARLRGERFEPVDTSPGRGAVALASDTRGRLYVGVFKGLLVLAPPEGASRVAAPRLHTVPGQESQGVQSIAVAPSGSVWYGCGFQLCRLDGESVVQRRDWGVPDDRWQAIRIDPQGSVWARSRTRLIELPKGEARFLRRDGDLPPAEDGELLMGRDGQLWVPTLRGLAHQTASGWDIVGKSRGLPISSVHCAMEDREGSIWVGLNGGGLVRWLGYPRWESWTEAEGLSSESAWGIRRDRAGVLWSVSDAGVSRFNQARRRWEELKVKGLASVQTSSLTPAPDGSLWVSQPTGALQVDLRRGVARAYGRESGLENPWVTSIVLDSQERVWIGTAGGLLRSVSGGRIRFERQQLPPASRPDLIYTILVDRKGRIWAGSSNGVLRLEAGRWSRLTTGNGLLHNRVNRLAEGADGSLWVGYVEPVGISQLVPDGDRLRWRHFSNRDGLRSNKVFFLGCDLRGWTWCGTDQGVDVFDGISWRHFDHTDGLAWDDCSGNAFWADPDGSVWMGTTRGISHLRISGAGLPERSTAAPVLLTAAVLGDRSVSLDGGISVPWWQRSLHVGFSALTFVNEDTVRFRYRIAGLEERWTETQSREAHIPSLPAGRYTFEVQANAGQSWWKEASARLSFTVRPAWWRTWWFNLMALAAAGLLARRIWAWRLRHILRRQRELEDAVADRTRNLEVEKAHAERERDTVEKQKVAIERLFQESRQAARLKDEFLANMSHEFRTPMNAVIGMTELVLDTTLTAEQREYLQTVRSSSGLLLGILDSILEISSIEAGKLDLDDVVFDLDEVVSGAVAKLSLRARQRHLTLLAQVGSNVPRRLLGDPRRLGQVLINLLSNAVKFTERGQVSLQVDPQEEAESPLLHFQIQDTGIGIPPEKQSLIFEPFSQADGSHTRRYGGAGVGLAVCARFVEMMEGRIWVESELGKGSRFHFTARFRRAPEAVRPEVPSGERTSRSLSALATAVEAEPAAGEESPGVAGNGVPVRSESPSVPPLRILLAEDNLVNQKLAVRLLQKRGHGVVTAANGTEALAAFARQPFDAVLMDVQMPEMDGLEATAEIRARERRTGQRIRIIAVTAHTGQADRERCLAAGMDDYVRKPIQPAELFAAVERPDRPAPSTIGASPQPRGGMSLDNTF